MRDPLRADMPYEAWPSAKSSLEPSKRQGRQVTVVGVRIVSTMNPILGADMTTYQYLIVGGGMAADSAARGIRDIDKKGSIAILSADVDAPYPRPALSKKLWTDPEFTWDQVDLATVADTGAELRLGTEVLSIDRDDKTVLTASGQVFGYQKLLLVTGLTPSRIDDDGDAVLYFRSARDYQQLRALAQPGHQFVVVGGGYIGLEAAAVASTLGLRVTLVEATSRILQRVAAPQTSDYFRALHAGRGVEVLEATGLLGMEALPGGTIAAHLGDGRTQVADFVIVGIGVVPNDALAAKAGLACDGGIVVDAQGRTSDPTIWAAGDCARFPWRGQSIRLESVQNAIDQAEAVAANILGAGRDYAAQPWFWSDQYDVKLQIAGLNAGYDHVAVRAGAGPARSHWYFRGSELLAIDAMNDPRAYMVGKRLIEAGRSPRPAQVADADTDLKALL